MQIYKLSECITLRPQQHPVFDAYFNQNIKNMVFLAHRRFGKGACFFTLTWCAALLRPGIYGYLLPTIGQSNRVIWDTVGEDGIRLIYRIPENLVQKYNNAKQMITLKNGSKIYVTGSDNYKRLIGMNFCFIIWDEFQDTNPAAVHAMRPMITRNKGFQAFLGTPRAYNHLGNMYKQQMLNPLWYSANLTVDDTVDEHGNRIVTEEDIQLERDNGMPEELILQEYYGSFDAAIRGAYFSEHLLTCRKEGRIGNYPHNRLYPVYSGLDLGFDDSTTCWFVQIYDGYVHLIDYFEYRQSGIEKYTAYVGEKKLNHGWRMSTEFAPHDVENGNPGTGKSTFTIARELGTLFQRVERPAKKLHGIQCIRFMFKRFRFNEATTRTGLMHLYEYRPEYDERKQVYSLQPMRNAATHAADGLQTFCMGWMKAFEPDNLRKQYEIANCYGNMIW